MLSNHVIVRRESELIGQMRISRLEIVRYPRPRPRVLCHTTHIPLSACTKLGRKKIARLIIQLLETSFSHISHMQVDPLNLFKHFSFLTSMLLQMQAVSPATLEPLCHKDPACKSLSAPPVTGSHSTSGAALLASHSKTWWATRSKSADTPTVSAAHHNLYSCKVTLLDLYILHLFPPPHHHLKMYLCGCWSYWGKVFVILNWPSNSFLV